MPGEGTRIPAVIRYEKVLAVLVEIVVSHRSSPWLSCDQIVETDIGQALDSAEVCAVADENEITARRVVAAQDASGITRPCFVAQANGNFAHRIRGGALV